MAEPKASPPVVEKTDEVAELQDIKSAMNLSEKTIILVTNIPVKHTTYMLENPPRLVLELLPARNMIPASPIIIDDDLVDKISLYEFKKAKAVRLEIALKSEAKYAVVARDVGIEVKIIPLSDKKDPALLARRLMEAQAQVEKLSAENAELKALLELQNAKLRENEERIKKLEKKRRVKPKTP